MINIVSTNSSGRKITLIMSRNSIEILRQNFIFHHFHDFKGNLLTEESLPSFAGITYILMEFERYRLTGDSLPSFPGIPENYLVFNGNHLIENSLPSFPVIPEIIDEDDYY